MSPAQAVGRLFIPVHNFFWLVQVFRGFASDYNQYCQRHSISGARLYPLRLFLSFALLLLASSVPANRDPVLAIYLCVQAIVVAEICDAVNRVSLPDRATAASRPVVEGETN